VTARQITIIITVLLAVLAALALWLIPDPKQSPAALLQPDNPTIVTLGGEIYAANCASCHGTDLKGQPDWQSPGADGLMPAPPHDETGHTWHHPDQILFAITKYGVAKAANLKDYKSAMPVYENLLADDEIIAVLSWVKAQWPAEIREGHDQMNAQYQAQEKVLNQ
jgi:mono/diheme cytochrome c family protein